MSKLWGGHEGAGQKISVIAQMHAAGGKIEELRSALVALVDPSQGEVGCAIYHILEDKTDQGKFFTYEEWESEDALKQHLETNKAALDHLKELVEGEMKLSVLELVR